MATTGDDCYFFYYSTCTKGSLCPYRHSPEALGNEVTCHNWKQGFCYRPNCAFRHMEISKNRSEIQCYWETQPTGCQKPHCTFKHFKRGTIEGASTTKSSMSLINKLPTITGPVTKAPPITSVPAPAVPLVTPIIQPSVQASQEMEEAISMPTVKPVVVTPMDSEDDESVSTMSTDGSPSKRLLVSPVRPSIRPPPTSVKDQPISRGPVRTFNKVKPPSSQDKPHTFGIKTLAEIRREKERERGHDTDGDDDLEKGKQKEEKMVEEELVKEMPIGKETMDLEDFLEEEESLYPSLTRRIISVSSTEDKQPTTKPANRRALIQGNRLGETGVGSLAGTQDENGVKRLGRSLEQGDRERESIKKRIKISNTDFPLEAEIEVEPKKKITRRVVVGAGATKKVEADSSSLDSVKIKTVAEIKKEKLAQRLGRVVGDGGVKDDIAVATSAASRRTGLAERLGNVTRTFGSDDEGRKSKDSDADASRKRSLAGRLGTTSRTVKTGEEEEEADKNLPASRRAGSLALRLGNELGDDKASERSRSGNDRTAVKATVGLATRLGRVVGTERASESSGKDRTPTRATVGLATRMGRDVGVERSSGSGIKIKSLEEIKREKLLRRLGKLPGEGDEARSSDGERQASSQEEEEEEEEEEDDDNDDSSEEDSSSEDMSDIDLPEEDTSEEEAEKEKEEAEKKKSLGEIRIKTLEEIRLEKQRRLGTHIGSKPAQDVDMENTRESLKKGVQSAQERRNRKRTEMALYKPPAANRGSKENQSSAPGLWRSVLNVKETERKSDVERPTKVRRLNLSKSVETANKGTESVLNLIKQKKEGSGEEASSIKVKSLAEIRAEKQRLGRLAGGDNSQGDQETDPSDPGDEMERTSSLSPERRKMKEKTEEEKRRERRGKIWSRVENDGDGLQKPVTSDMGQKDEGKTLDQLRRERRARLWNITPAGDAPSQSVIRRPGHVTSSSDQSASGGEIKIKTLAEIRREKQLREQQRQEQQENRNGNRAAATSSTENQAATSSTNFTQSTAERTINPTPTSVFENDSFRVGMDSKEASVLEMQGTDAFSVTGEGDMTAKDHRLEGSRLDSAQEENERRIRPMRTGAGLETGNQATVPDSVDTTETLVSQEDLLPVSTSATSTATKLSRKTLKRRLGRVVANTSQETVQVETQETSSQEQAFEFQSVPPQAAETPSAFKEANTAPLDTKEGSRLEREKVESSFVDDPNISLISLGSEPDTTTVDSTTADDNMAPQSKQTPKRLASMTDDEDLHRFLEEHDEDLDDDLDGDHATPAVASVTHDDDDDLLNELDDFLNS